MDQQSFIHLNILNQTALITEKNLGMTNYKLLLFCKFAKRLKDLCLF